MAARDRRRFPPPGMLVDVGGHRLHLLRSGTGGPTVVLESGLGCTYLDWTQVQQEASKFAEVCSYDRAGRGYSEPGPRPRDAGRIADELHALLARAGIRPPYVLVGHSLGGLYARVFADRYRADVCGIVLVDAPPEDQGTRWPARSFAARACLEIRWRLFQLNPLLARLGILRILGKPWASRRGMPRELRQRERALGLQSRAYDWIFDESSAIAATEAEAGRSEALGDLPLAVVTAAHTPDLSDQTYASWLEMQRGLCRLSSNSTHLVARTSGHVVALEEPELVVEAIRWVIAQVTSPRG